MNKQVNTEPTIPLSEVEKLLEEKIKQAVESVIKEYEYSKVEETATNKNDEVRFDDYVEVMSLCPMPLNLSTEGNGRGLIFKFSKFGEIKRILYKDLVNILENHRSFLESGYFYILNKKVVRVNGLEEIYSKILSKEKILAILDSGDRTAIQLFDTCNDNQKKLIVEIIIQRLLENEESVDLNVVDKISRMSGINIQEKFNFSKNILKPEKEE